MAQPIPLHIAPRDPREELRSKVNRAPEQYGEALIAACEVLQELHDRGVLDILRSGLAAGDELLATVVEDLDTPGSIRALRSLLVLRDIVGGIDPDSLKSAAAAIPEELARATAASEKPPSLWELLRRLRSPDARRGLAAAVTLLEGLGRRLDAKA